MPHFARHPLKVGNRVTKAADLTLRETLFPLFLVTILYFLWGFAYGLLDTLNKHFQNTLHITRTRSSGLQAAYFGAYPLASLGYGNWVLRHYGYRAVFIMGLILYGIGAFMMWPAALKRSFGGFCGATFIIGSGLGCLETAANPYMAVTGPPKFAELRINLAQAVQAVGTVVGPVLGSYVFFSTTADDVSALQSVQWVYLAIGCFVFLLAVIFYFSVIPEVTDADMAEQADITHSENKNDDKPFWKQYRLFHAAWAQFCYTGAQVAIASYFINYVTETRPSTSSALGAQFLAIAQGCFAIGRFTGSGLMKFVKPRIVFLIYLTCAMAFCAASIRTRDNTGLAMLMITLFFESVCFPTIVALGIRGLGRHTKRASGWVVAGVAGGACIPPILARAADNNNSTAFAMIVPTMFFISALTYAICVNFVPAYKIPVDLIGDGLVGRVHYRSDHHRYNMKRRVAGLPPVSAATFNEKVLERRQETSIMSSLKGSTCEVCNKTYSSENAYRSHINSKKHKENELKAARKPLAPIEPEPEVVAKPESEQSESLEPSTSQAEEKPEAGAPVSLVADEDADDEEVNETIDQKIAAARSRLSTTHCLFCPSKSPTIEENLSHMSSAHSFFIPDSDYLTDLPGLITYLGEKIAVGNVCIYCNGKGREFRTLDAVRKHMLDKSHCKVAYETENDRLEISDYYDFTSSYPEAKLRKKAKKKKQVVVEDEEWEDFSGDEDGEVDEVVEEEYDSDEDESDESDDIPDGGLTYGDSHYELVLPSGARIGHRSLRRYYAQSFTPVGSKASSDPNSGAAIVRRLLADKNSELVPTRGGFGAFGGGTQVVKARNRGEAKEAGRHVREFRDQARREHFKTKVGFRHNNQKHFRDPLLQ
ncbi:hypothetical protein V5O48_001681 [Marasmius crinis-equi]|uniref:C2H2-type domain-containing protein n=1 Tax=Marasmius crinis-equi TaxID=585013 RepID=A0ABR3FYZ3_9AGAR